MATTGQAPTTEQTLAAVETLYSRIAAPAPPLQFTGITGARYNMGAGQPDPASLPRVDLDESIGAILNGEDGAAALMYGDASGYVGLREALAEKLRKTERIEASADEILIVNGSNHGLAIVSQAFINPGDVAIVESPTFMGGLRPLRQLQARIEMVPIDTDGLRVDLLEDRLRALRREGAPAKLLYTIPNFHNPAGVDLALERRQRIAALAEEFNFIILEDDAYGELRFTGEPIPSLYNLAPKGRVLRSATLSKILAAGLRVGYLIGPKEMLARLNGIKLDGGASPFINRVAANWLRTSYDKHVPRLIEIYRQKRDALVEAIVNGFPVGDPLKPEWYLPKGGFFLWMKLPPGVDPASVAKEAGERGIAYVPGPVFFADGSGQEYVRLAWSMLSVPDLKAAGKLFADAVHASAR